MEGTDRQRFCEKCQHTVHDLSSLTRKEAARLVESARGQRLCGRISKNSQGDILFCRHSETTTGRLARIAGLSLIGVGAVAAQSDHSCALKVAVTDATGAAIGGAGVTLKGASLGGKTSDQGLYATRAPEGSGEIQISSPGFKDRKVGISCKADAPIDVSVRLDVAVTDMGVMVYAGPPPRQKSSSKGSRQ